MSQWSPEQWSGFAAQVGNILGDDGRVFDLSTDDFVTHIANSGGDPAAIAYILGAVTNDTAFEPTIRRMEALANSSEISIDTSRLISRVAEDLRVLSFHYSNDSDRKQVQKAAERAVLYIPQSPDAISFDGAGRMQVSRNFSYVDAVAETGLFPGQGGSPVLRHSAAPGQLTTAVQLPAVSVPVNTNAGANTNAVPRDGIANWLGDKLGWVAGHNISSSLTKMTVEWMASASLPVYIMQRFHSMAALFDVAIISMLANVIGPLLSPLVTNRLPLRLAYTYLLGASFVAALSIGLFTNNYPAIERSVLYGLYFAYRMVQSMSLAAENTIPASVVGHDESEMERVRDEKLTWNSFASILLQTMSASFVPVLGTAAKNFIVAPLLYLPAIIVAWFTLKGESLKHADDARIAEYKALADKTRDHAGAFRMLRQIADNAKPLTQGYNFVMGRPVLRTATIASALFTAFMWLTFVVFAPLYAAHVVSHGDPNLLTPIRGLITAMFGVGSLYAGKLGKWLVNRLRKEYKNKEEVDEATRRSAIQWVLYGALASLFLGAMAVLWPAVGPLLGPAAITAIMSFLGLTISPVTGVAAMLALGSGIAVQWPKLGLALLLSTVFLTFPLHVAIVSMFFLGLGLVQGIAGNKTDSLFDKVVKRDNPGRQADARAFVIASTVLFATVLAVILKFLAYGQLPFDIPSPMASFKGLPGDWPFMAFFVIGVVPATFLGLRVSRQLDKLTKPKR